MSGRTPTRSRSFPGTGVVKSPWSSRALLVMVAGLAETVTPRIPLPCRPGSAPPRSGSSGLSGNRARPSNSSIACSKSSRAWSRSGRFRRAARRMIPIWKYASASSARGTASGRPLDCFAVLEDRFQQRLCSSSICGASSVTSRPPRQQVQGFEGLAQMRLRPDAARAQSRTPPLWTRRPAATAAPPPRATRAASRGRPPGTSATAVRRPARRAWIGSPARNRRRSAANSSAVWYAGRGVSPSP